MESIINHAKLIAQNLLPEKSKDRYVQEYDNLVKWKEEKGIDKNNFSEEVMLVYFDELQKKYKPSSLWCFYSMLRTAIERNNNIDINYPKLQTLLKMASVGFVPKKSSVFEGDEIRKFLHEAADIDHLATKVIVIFGIYGAARADELMRVDVADVKQHGAVFVVKFPQTKTNIVRSFTIEDENAGYVTKYQMLRPTQTTTSRFFLRYQIGKCYNQPIGRNKFLSIPKIVAGFLNLPDAHLYTGHSFRRTSTTLLANAGANMLILKQHGGWKSDTSVIGYVQNSINNKRKIGGLIAGEINLSTKTKSTASSTITSGAEEEPINEPTVVQHPTSTITSGAEQEPIVEPTVVLPIENESIGTSTIISSTSERSHFKSTVICSQSVTRVTTLESPVGIENIPPNFYHDESPGNIVSVESAVNEAAFKKMDFHNCTITMYFGK